METHFLPVSKYVLCTSTPNTHICAEFQDEVYDTRFSKMFCPNMPLQGQHTFCQLMSKSEHFTKHRFWIYMCKWKRYHVTCTSAACISSYIIKPVRPSLYNTLPGYRGVRHWIIATEIGIWVYPFHWFIVMLLHVTGNHSLGYFVKTVTCISKTLKCH